MELSPKVTQAILEADSKAIATTGKHGINVVPVSTVRVVGNKILLMNYFLHKTLENILEQPHVALACWKGLEGYQIKGTVEYIEEGEQFEEAKKWIEENVADRTLLGLLILTPEEVYNISPGAN
jgi:predicted pyridoxine 5'-phosphate oxidase superfamily flavin-nucleotide-binding protein